jgi:hypothetical protein
MLGYAGDTATHEATAAMSSRRPTRLPRPLNLARTKRYIGTGPSGECPKWINRYPSLTNAPDPKSALVPLTEVEYLGRPISSTDLRSEHLSLGRLTALVGAIACRSFSPRSRNICLGALLLLCGERIEIDDLRIVLMGIAIGPSAAMNMHQGLHTPGI